MQEISDVNLLTDTVEIPFENRVEQLGEWPIKADQPAVLQMNLGYVCNQSCAHCHLEAGPNRTESMSDEVIEGCFRFADEAGIKQFDLTGGAPELHPKFRYLVEEIRKRSASVIDRCNLTILSEPGQDDLAEFLAGNQVHVTSSLPHYRSGKTDMVRGVTVFERSIEGLRKLNAVGYGKQGTGLELTLVHNPSGALLPGSQSSLETEYMRRLKDEHCIEFNHLIAMTNMPLGRFLKFLEKSGNLQRYMKTLEQNFNRATLDCLMCRDMISVSWDGTLYDCDFNQCLKLAIGNGHNKNIRYITNDELAGRAIRCLSHCYGCTAGQGSSCGGAVAE